MTSEHDELGLKVQRAQHALDAIRGTGTVDGVTVQVDAENYMVAVSGPHGKTILAAYQVAVREMQPRISDALCELADDPQVESTLAFTEANRVPIEPQRLGPAGAEDDADIFEQGW